MSWPATNFTAADGNSPACRGNLASSSKNSYRSYCEPGDGVCGGAFGAKDNSLKLAGELAAALGCVSGSCAHLDYWADGPSTWDLVNGATLMVQWLGVPVLA